jgi:hypothetical protein
MSFHANRAYRIIGTTKGQFYEGIEQVYEHNVYGDRVPRVIGEAEAKGWTNLRAVPDVF